MICYDKSEIKKQITLEHVFEVLQTWGGDPQYTNFGIISSTICHNAPGEGSRKLYYYTNSNLFHCYTGCASPSFDIFELIIKVVSIQKGIEYDLNDAVMYISNKFGFSGTHKEVEEISLQDWQILNNYDRIQNIELQAKEINLKEYDSKVLDNLNYSVKIAPWLDEGMTQEALNRAKIGFFPGGDQITIPHFDIEGRFIGLRGRALNKEEAEKYGKYRPVVINKQIYSHPLGMNLYGLNLNKNNIKTIKKAIVFESEKSVILYDSYFGEKNNIAVACCGSNLSAFQMQLLLDLGVDEVVIAFDRQFETIGDDQFKKLTNNLRKLSEKYKNYVKISFIFDKEKITSYKASPIDEGSEKFLQLFKKRIILS